MLIKTDENTGQMEIYEIPKNDINYLTSHNKDFHSIVKTASRIFYFKGVKLNISNEENYTLITRIIEEYNTKVEEAYILAKDVDKRLSKIESNFQWIWRTIAGALIVIIISAIAVYFKISK
jgi:hypothetical protein